MGSNYLGSTHEYKPIHHNVTASSHAVSEPDPAGSSPRAGRRDGEGTAIWHFARHNVGMMVALSTGLAGAYACFAFTYWLSQQRFYCPPWAYDCTVQKPVRFFVVRLGLVQGFLSSIYGICITCIAYVSFQIAETTLWPLLAKHALNFKEMDRFLAYARGSLAAVFPVAWHIHGWSHAAIVLVVGLVGLLLQANSTIVGYAFTVVPVTTAFRSNHTTGGGMGFMFSQSNPPPPIPGEVQAAANYYSSWSTAQSVEMLPELRSFMFDRTNLSAIGNFTVDALEVRKSINCYPEPLQVVDDSTSTGRYSVRTHLESAPADYSLGSGTDSVVLLFSPGPLTTYVDSYKNLSETRAVTKLVFATLNGSIEGGHLSEYLQEDCSVYGSRCIGISALACEVDIDLVPGTACNGPCRRSTSAPLTSGELTIQGQNTTKWPLSVALAGGLTVFGAFTYGAQPMFKIGEPLANSSYSLPYFFSDYPTGAVASQGFYYSAANLTNFIDVAVGAMAIGISGAFAVNSTIVDSYLDLPRLDTGRSYALLAPPAIALASIAFLAAMSWALHRSIKVQQVRLGATSEIFLSCAKGDVMAKAMAMLEHDAERSGEKLEEIPLRYGWMGDKTAALGSADRVTPFSSG